MTTETDTASSQFGNKIMDVRFATDYVFEMNRNVGFTVGLDSTTGNIFNWDNDTTSGLLYNRTKEVFAEFPVKAYGKGTSRILQNMAIGVGVRLYAKLLSTSLFSTTLSGYVIAVS